MKPYFSIVGMAGGLLAGLGVLVLLQQAGVVYPTLIVTIVALVLGLLYGIAVPTLKVARRRRQLDHRIAALEAKLR